MVTMAMEAAMTMVIVMVTDSWKRPINDRIEQLRKRIRSVEEYNLKYNDKANSDSGINELKLLKDGEK